jgi:hypothetical protein
MFVWVDQYVFLKIRQRYDFYFYQKFFGKLYRDLAVVLELFLKFFNAPDDFVEVAEVDVRFYVFTMIHCWRSHDNFFGAYIG